MKAEPLKEPTKIIKAETRKEPEQHTLQYQIEKLNEISKMVGVPEPERRVEGSVGNLPVSFVSPLTESKKIKFEQAPVPQKEQAFMKGQTIGTTAGSPIKTPFQKKESVGTVATFLNSDNQLITTSSPSLTQLGVAKSKTTVPTFGQGTTVQQAQTTTTTTSSPTKSPNVNVITIKHSSTNR